MRSLVAGVLLLAGVLMVPVATAGWWVRDTLVPTESYVDTVAPLATDDAIVAAVEDELVDETMRAIDDAELVQRLTTALERGGLPPAVTERLDRLSGPLRARLEVLVRVAVERVVEDPAFADAWEAANRVAHEQLVAVLSGDRSAIRIRPDSTVDVRLATLATALRQELIDAGVPFAEALPTVEASFPIGNAEELARAQRAYTQLDRWGRLLPLVALGLLAGGVLLARRRSGALAWAALGSLVAMGALAVGVVLGRVAYLDALPAGLPTSAAEAGFDTVTAGLRHDMVLVSGTALAVLLLAVVLRLLRPSG